MKYFFLLLFLFTFLNAEEKNVIIKDGKSNYKIIISKNANENEKKAALILKEYLKKISTTEIDILIDTTKETPYEFVIGNTNRLKKYRELKIKLPLDGYRIITKNGKIFFQAGLGKGIIYSVTGFLEDHLGCRKYSPDYEYIPQKKDIILPQINDKQIPSAEIRIINGNLCNDEEYRNWRRLSTVQEKWGSGSFKGYYVHTFNKIIPPEKYFDKHPEYFSYFKGQFEKKQENTSLFQGKRIPFGQLCLTNPDVLKLTIEHLKEMINKYPDIKYWSVSQNDNFENCECPECSKVDSIEGSPSGSLLRFINKVAKEFPDKIITTLAYEYSRKPPKITKPEKNVMITLCTIELNRSKPIEEDSTSKDFVEDINGWSKICNNIMLWDYEVQFTNYLCPFPLFHTLKSNIELFNKYNVKAHFQQCNVEHGNEFAELKAYLISKLLWNPKLNDKEIIDDFINGYYGNAGNYIKEYFNLLHSEGIKSGQRLDIYDSPISYANTFLSEDNIKRYKEIFDKAEESVINNPEVLERVKVARLPIMYSELEIAKSNVLGKRGFFVNNDGKYILIPQMKNLIDTFFAIVKRHNIKTFNETNLTPQIYFDNLKRTLNIQVENNKAFMKPITCLPIPSKKYFASGPSTLTNGILGTIYFKNEWLGWENQDIEIVVDLEKTQLVNKINLSTLQDLNAWITHPIKIELYFSNDNENYSLKSSIQSDSDLRKESQIKNFTFNINNEETRFIKFKIKATKTLPEWHKYAGNKSWLFIDEITVE